MTSIENARDDLENSVEVFLHCKSLISKTLGSVEQTLRFQRQNLENALKDLGSMPSGDADLKIATLTLP